MNIGIIISSTRPGRIGDHISKLYLNTIPKDYFECFKFEMIDLLQWQLPLYNEPGIPKQEKGKPYVHELTNLWSQKIASMDAFIFVTPQYNHGYPASLKNALDFLYYEWVNKPAIICSYGSRGGGKAAEQLKQVLLGLKMIPMDTMPAIKLQDVVHREGTTDDHSILLENQDEIKSSIEQLKNKLLSK
ncbi:unnamed protein product [Cunninghamella blakesleeana]